MTEHNETGRTGKRKWNSSHPAWARSFVQLPASVLCDPGLSAGAVRAYCLLLHLAWRNNGTAEPELPEGAAMLGCSEKTLNGYIKELASAGLVTKKRRGLGMTNAYTVHPPDTPEKGATGTVDSTVQEAAVSTDPRAGASTGVDLEQRQEEHLARPAATRKRDVAFDAMAEVTDSDPQLEGSRIAQAVNKLRKHDGYAKVKEQHGRDVAEEGLAQAIRVRAAQYHEYYEGRVTLTPSALVANWKRVQTPRGEGRGLTAEQIMQKAREES